MKNNILKFGAILLFAVALITACNDMGNNTRNQSIGNFLTISPSDNAQDVGLNQSVTIQFAAPVDKKVIESNFVLISQRDMSDSTCPVSNNMGHSDMNRAMIDSTMMKHLQKTHCTKGTFTWNSDSTKCIFKADSALKSNTEYMMYIDSDMMNHMKSVMLSNGMMGGGMGMMNCDCGNKGLNNSTVATHFKTGSKY